MRSKADVSQLNNAWNQKIKYYQKNKEKTTENKNIYFPTKWSGLKLVESVLKEDKRVHGGKNL